MNKKTLKDLGYFKLIEILKDFTQSERAKALADELIPYNDLDLAVKEAKRITQLKRLVKESKNIPLGEISDVKSILEFSKIENSALDVDNIVKIRENLSASKKLKNFLDGISRDKYPYLIEFIDRLHPAEELMRLIKRTIGANGEILDSASEALRSIRSEIKEKREVIIARLTATMNAKKNAPIIQENVITIRNDRYVLVVKPNYNEFFDGIIHGDSNSGASYFVEPFTLIEDNNKMNLLITGEKEEMLNILRALTGGVRTHIGLIVENLEALTEFDLLLAKARLSETLNMTEANLKMPGTGKIDLKNARHPLLYFDSLTRSEGEKVIPIQIKFDDDKCGMVLSGANSGGKTAALKTLGLLSLMAKSGMHISADDSSSLISFDKIYTDIGDEQDILKSKGTFSSHLINIKDIVDDTDKDTLVLLDELGTGTDPTEGSALFSALMDHLLETGCYFVATTHLDKIKHYAYVNKRVENVSVAFNNNTLKPEYRLLYNQIGRSNAINLAKEIGFAESILNKADTYMTGEELKLSSLIEELSKERSEILKEKDETAVIKRDALTLKEKYRNILSKLKAKREELFKKKERELSDIFYDTKKRLKQIIKSKRDDITNDIQAFEDLTVLKKEIKKKFLLPKRSSSHTDDLKKGDTAFVKSLNKNGEVIKLDEKKKTALVNVGSVKVDVPLSDLSKSGNKNTQKEYALNVSTELSGVIKYEINIIGKTVDEALPLVDRFLDDAYISNLEEVTIIHGKGTGRLRRGVLDHLQHAPYVERILEGKDIISALGATTVKIKH